MLFFVLLFKQSISAYVGVAYNIGNLVPFLYVLLQRWLPRESITFGFFTFVATGPAVVLAFYWDREIQLIKSLEIYSWPLLSMAFIAGAFGTTISVILYSYLARYRAWVTTAAAVGMGLCSVVISALGRAQNNIKSPRKYW